MELEYKIITSQTPLFANTARMQEILDEEAKAGWSLHIKEDNYHIKLVRETSCRENDRNLDIDPYRSTVGLSPIVTYGATAILTIAIVTTILYLALWSNT